MLKERRIQDLAKNISENHARPIQRCQHVPLSPFLEAGNLVPRQSELESDSDFEKGAILLTGFKGVDPKNPLAKAPGAFPD